MREKRVAQSIIMEGLDNDIKGRNLRGTIAIGLVWRLNTIRGINRQTSYADD